MKLGVWPTLSAPLPSTSVHSGPTSGTCRSLPEAFSSRTFFSAAQEQPSSITAGVWWMSASARWPLGRTAVAHMFYTGPQSCPSRWSFFTHSSSWLDKALCLLLSFPLTTPFPHKPLLEEPRFKVDTCHSLCAEHTIEYLKASMSLIERSKKKIFFFKPKWKVVAFITTLLTGQNGDIPKLLKKLWTFLNAMFSFPVHGRIFMIIKNESFPSWSLTITKPICLDTDVFGLILNMLDLSLRVDLSHKIVSFKASNVGPNVLLNYWLELCEPEWSFAVLSPF